MINFLLAACFFFPKRNKENNPIAFIILFNWIIESAKIFLQTQFNLQWISKVKGLIWPL